MIFFALGTTAMPTTVKNQANGGVFSVNAGFPKARFVGSQYHLAINYNIVNINNAT